MSTITKEYLESLIKDVQYHTFQNTAITVCCIYLKVGGAIIGDSIGDKKNAYTSALTKLRDFATYAWLVNNTRDIDISVIDEIKTDFQTCNFVFLPHSTERTILEKHASFVANGQIDIKDYLPIFTVSFHKPGAILRDLKVEIVAFYIHVIAIKGKTKWPEYKDSSDSRLKAAEKVYEAMIADKPFLALNLVTDLLRAGTSIGALTFLECEVSDSYFGEMLLEKVPIIPSKITVASNLTDRSLISIFPPGCIEAVIVGTDANNTGKN